MDEEHEHDPGASVSVSPKKLGPLTAEEQRKWFEVLEILDRHRAEQLARRGGKLYPNAWEEFPDPGDEIYDEPTDSDGGGEVT